MAPRKDFDVSPVKRPVLYLGYFCCNCVQFPNGKCTGTGSVSFLYRENGLVLISNRSCVDGSGCTSSGIVWSSVIQHYLLSVKDTGADVSSRNNCQRRIWFYLWCVYAGVQFRRRITEIFILPSGYVWNISAEKSYVKRCVCTDERGWIFKTECHRDCKKSGLPSDVQRRSCFYAGDDCCYGSEHSDIGSGLFGGDSYFYKKEYRQILGIDKKADDSINIDKKWNNLTKIKI